MNHQAKMARQWYSKGKQAGFEQALEAADRGLEQLLHAIGRQEGETDLFVPDNPPEEEEVSVSRKYDEEREGMVYSIRVES